MQLYAKKLKCRVLSVEPLSKRVEVTLKTLNANAPKSEIENFSSVHVGDIITGRIKRVESFGLFITIDDTKLVKNGLYHAKYNHNMFCSCKLLWQTK